ncbi:hypothetical protein VTK26DRAFT_3542 [Humicola hyalothermophila]
MAIPISGPPESQYVTVAAPNGERTRYPDRVARKNGATDASEQGPTILAAVDRYFGKKLAF